MINNDIKTFDELKNIKSMGFEYFERYFDDFNCNLKKKEKVLIGLGDKKGFKRFLSSFAYRNWGFFRYVFKLYHSIKKTIINPNYFHKDGYYAFSESKGFLPVISEGFSENIVTFVFSNFKRLQNVYNDLQDEVSKKTYLGVLISRLTFCPKHLLDITENKKSQYFDIIDFTGKKELIFLDGGAYEGETSYDFVLKYNNLTKIYMFEPNKNSLIQAKKNLKRIINVDLYYYNKGLSNTNTKRCFADEGPASTINFQNHSSLRTNDFTEEIEIIKIDDLNISKIDFIKLDIEGEELNALKGAEKTILKNKPELAICIYHRNSDYFTVQEYINSLKLDYKFYIRHYDIYSTHETVLYCTQK